MEISLGSRGSLWYDVLGAPDLQLLLSLFGGVLCVFPEGILGGERERAEMAPHLNPTHVSALLLKMRDADKRGWFNGGCISLQG